MPDSVFAIMTGDESRILRIRARVFWAADPKDQGTITSINWNSVNIRWNDGHTSLIHHNDMAGVTTAGLKQ